jgi:hypothetical protein
MSDSHKTSVTHLEHLRISEVSDHRVSLLRQQEAPWLQVQVNDALRVQNPRPLATYINTFAFNAESNFEISSG